MGLDERVKKLLAPPLDQHARVASLRDQVLVIQADSPAWAARIRYLVPELLGQLDASTGQFPRIQSIRVRVAVEPCAQAREPAHRPPVSVQAAVELRRQAETVSDDRLRDALLRLARGRRTK
jgi:hypothetical protein